MSGATTNQLIDVELLPIDGAHGDLRFRVLGEEWVADSYYLVIDRTFEERWARLEVRAFRRLAVGDLFRQWLEVARELRPSGEIFLPFDYSDECMGHLRVIAAGESAVRLNYGWSMVNGYTLAPNNIRLGLAEGPGFRPKLGEDRFVARGEFMRELERVVGELA